MLKIIHWIKNHKNIAATLAFITLLGVGLALAMFKQLQDVESRSWETLAVGQYLSMSDKSAEAHEQFRNLQSNYQRSKVADFAYIYDAAVYAREGKWQAALDNYQKVLHRDRTTQVLALAQIGAAKMQEALNNLDEAQKAYLEFQEKYPDHFAAPEAYEGLARIGAVRGQWDKAKENLERLRVLYPDTNWGHRAEMRLKGLMGTK